jgi:hypothetical protein
MAKSLGVDMVFYNIGENFFPRHVDVSLGDLYVANNYFGLLSADASWSSHIGTIDPGMMIIDNTQSLCSKNQFEGRYSFISPRKFLPVTDGGILFVPEQFQTGAPPIPPGFDASWGRIHWLFRAIDENGRDDSYASYRSFRKNEVQSIEYSQMSRVTRYLLQLYDIDCFVRERNRKFSVMRSSIPIHHRFRRLHLEADACPIGYPIDVVNAAESQLTLAKQKIYSVRFWPDPTDKNEFNSFERSLADEALFIPIDDRYEEEHYSFIFDEIRKDID